VVIYTAPGTQPNFSLRKFDPLTFVSRLPNRDLIQKALKDRHAIEGLHITRSTSLTCVALPLSELIDLGVRVGGQSSQLRRAAGSTTLALAAGPGHLLWRLRSPRGATPLMA